MALTFSKTPPAASPRKRRPMNNTSLAHLATRIFNTPLLIHPRKGDAILNVLGPRLGLAAEVIPVVAIDDQQDGIAQKSYAVNNGIATIPITGTLVKKSTGMSAMSGMTSYEDLTEQITDAATDPDVKGILFDVDSPGGEAAGMSDLSDLIYSRRGSKPMYAISNDDCYSAAYGLASAADKVFVTGDGGCGSVGCYMLHLDRSGYNKQNGLKFTYIYAGDKKVDGNPMEPLSDTAEADLQAEVNRVRDMFVSLVARNRNVTPQQIFDLQAGCQYAQAATPLLADQVGNLGAVTAALCIACGVDPGADDSGGGSDDDLPITGLPMGAARAGLRIGAGPIPSHSTATTDTAWDGPANEARLTNGASGSYYRKFYAWVDSSADDTKKSSFKFGHHMVSGDGSIGAANVQACQAIIANLNGARSAPKIPSGDRQGVYNHAARHLRDAGKDPAPLKSEAEVYDLYVHGAPTLRSDGLALGDPGGPAIYLLRDMESERSQLSARMGVAAISRLLRSSHSHASASADERSLNMLVVPYGQLSADLGGFKELYQRGCFEEGLGNDPRAVFNHDSACILGRKSANTATFWEDAAGVHVDCEAPETNWADDLLVSMRRGDITQASAAFFILGYHWEVRSGERVRVVEKALMREAGPQSFPAYESTQAVVQPESLAAQGHELELAEARFRLLRLG